MRAARGFYMWMIAAVFILFISSGCAAQDGQDINASSQAPEAATDTKGACSGFALDEAHKVPADIEAKMNKGISPRSPGDGSALEKIILIPDNPDVMDERTQSAYYSRSEGMFWVLDMNSESSTWYGPYKGYPCVSR